MKIDYKLKTQKVRWFDIEDTRDGCYDLHTGERLCDAKSVKELKPKTLALIVSGFWKDRVIRKVVDGFVFLDTMFYVSPLHTYYDQTVKELQEVTIHAS